MDMDAMVTDSHQLMMSEEQRQQLFKVKVLLSWSPPHTLTRRSQKSEHLSLSLSCSLSLSLTDFVSVHVRMRAYT